MKTYQVVLTKSYLININTRTAEQAKRFAEFYTSNIQDISTSKDRCRFNFSIVEINCELNESLEAKELIEK